MNTIYVLIILTGMSTSSDKSVDIKLYTINGFTTLQSCQNAEFKTKDQQGILNAFCIKKDI